MHCLGVEHAQPGQDAAVGRAVLARHELIAATDRQHGRAVTEIVKDLICVMSSYTLAGQFLLPVLPTADQVEIVTPVEPITPLDARHTQIDVAPGGPPAQAGHVAPICVQIHEVGIQVGEAQRGTAGCHGPSVQYGAAQPRRVHSARKSNMAV